MLCTAGPNDLLCVLVIPNTLNLVATVCYLVDPLFQISSCPSMNVWARCFSHRADITVRLLGVSTVFCIRALFGGKPRLKSDENIADK